MAVDVRSDAGALLKVLGEPLRWEIVRRLAAEDLCTCHLAGDLGTAQPLLSHHLRVLRQAGVVHTERVGAFTYYLLNRELLSELSGGPGRPGRCAGLSTAAALLVNTDLSLPARSLAEALGTGMLVARSATGSGPCSPRSTYPSPLELIDYRR